MGRDGDLPSSPSSSSPGSASREETRPRGACHCPFVKPLRVWMAAKSTLSSLNLSCGSMTVDALAGDVQRSSREERDAAKRRRKDDR
jgi:hypothetical protein